MADEGWVPPTPSQGGTGAAAAPSSSGRWDPANPDSWMVYSGSKPKLAPGGQYYVDSPTFESQALANSRLASDQKVRTELTKIAKSMGMETGYGTLNWLWQQGVNGAAALAQSGKNVTVVDYLKQWAKDGGDSGSGSRTSGSGYTGPRTTSSNAFMDPQSAEMLLNDLATDMLGRSLTQDELAKYTKRFRKMEQQNPTVTTTSQTSSMSQQGMDDKDIARTILEKDPTFADQVIRTDVLDMFMSRIDGKLGANG